jgi:Lipocalin-like domain
MKNKLEGAWELQSFEIAKSNGDIVYPFGKNVIGSIIYSHGRFSAQVMRGDRPLIASKDAMRATPEEMDANYKGVISYFGKYSLSDDETIVTHHVEGSLFPNWEGTGIVRFANLDNDVLNLKTQPTLWGDDEIVAALVWNKVK